MTDKFDDDKEPNAIKKLMQQGEPVSPIGFDVEEHDMAPDGREFPEPHAGEDDFRNSNFPPEEFQIDPLEALSEEDFAKAEKCALLDQNDRDNARRLNVWFGTDIGYVAGMGWIRWMETHWQRDEGDLGVRLVAQDLVDKIKLEALVLAPTGSQQKLLEIADSKAKLDADKLSPEDHKMIKAAETIRDNLIKSRAARKKFAVGSGNAQKTSAMLTQATSMKSVPSEALDADRMALNVENGTLEFSKEFDEEVFEKTGSETPIGKVAFRPHERKDMITRKADVSYDPLAECPKFHDFLERVQPSEDMRLFLQIFHGYAFLGGNGEQKLIYHFGEGANGKSIFIETLGRMLGSYRVTVSPDTITGDTNRQGQQASPDIARLFNARFATIEELPRGTPLRENLVKAVSGGSRMTARFLQKEIFEFEPIFTAILSGNEMPEITGTDNGIWRRMLLVKWGVIIPDEEQTPYEELLQILDEERAGILNWLVQGAVTYLSSGLTKFIPQEVLDFTQAYREDKDPVGQFLLSCVVTKEGATVRGRPLYEAFKAYCTDNAIKSWSEKNFGSQISKRLKKERRRGVVHYLDIALENIPDTLAGSGYD